MMSRIDELLAEALELPEDTRAELAAVLLESLVEPDQAPSPAFAAVQKRLAGATSGTFPVPQALTAIFGDRSTDH